MKIPYWYLLLGPQALYYLGGLFNVGVMALNHGAMPVLVPQAALDGLQMDANHQLMTAATHLKFFCDWINVHDLGIASPGDLLVWLGDYLTVPALFAWGAFLIKDHNQTKSL
jgi:hypothetical protein